MEGRRAAGLKLVNVDFNRRDHEARELRPLPPGRDYFAVRWRTSREYLFGHDLQARRGRRKKMAASRWSQPVTEAHPWSEVRRRNRDHIASSSRCRLIPPVTNI